MPQGCVVTAALARAGISRLRREKGGTLTRRRRDRHASGRNGEEKKGWICRKNAERKIKPLAKGIKQRKNATGLRFSAGSVKFFG